MDERQTQNAYPKTAACTCGALTLTASAPPRMTHACSCLNCQRSSGSSFSYSAFFAEADVKSNGPSKSWRSGSDAGRWADSHFCPTCGVSVFSRLEALPGMVCVPVGGFADPDFEAPGRLYWASRRHRWLELPDWIEKIETQ